MHPISILPHHKKRAAYRRKGMQPVGARRSAGQSSGDGSRGWRLRRAPRARECAHAYVRTGRSRPVISLSHTEKASAAPSQQRRSSSPPRCCLASWCARCEINILQLALGSRRLGPFPCPLCAACMHN